MSWWLKVHHNFKPPTPQMELTIMKINKTIRIFNLRLLLKILLLKRWNKCKFFKDQLGVETSKNIRRFCYHCWICKHHKFSWGSKNYCWSFSYKWGTKMASNHGRKNEFFKEEQHMDIVKAIKDRKPINDKWVFWL